MKCAKCPEHFSVPQNVKDKAALFGDPNGLLLCERCGICHLCLKSGEEEGNEEPDSLIRCGGCGFHYHRSHSVILQSPTGGPDAQKWDLALDSNRQMQKSEDYNGISEDPDTCPSCASLFPAPTYASLIGPEIPVFEREVLQTDRSIQKKVIEVIRSRKQEKTAEGISEVRLGDIVMAPQFASPYPEEYARSGTLFVCDKCLEYFPSAYMFSRHKRKCPLVYPPGNIVYLDSDKICIFEVAGEFEQAYCQSLCLLSKMFLHHKTLYHDVESFLFYVIGEITEEEAFRMYGYFSKEKAEGENNLSCIVVLPPFRKLGLGSFLIDFSYYLTRTRMRPPYIQGPEKPLSSAGEQAYLRYWADVIVRNSLARKNLPLENDGFKTLSEFSGVSQESLRRGYLHLVKVYKKKPGFSDFLSHRDLVKKVRRMKKYFAVQMRPVGADTQTAGNK